MAILEPELLVMTQVGIKVKVNEISFEKITNIIYT